PQIRSEAINAIRAYLAGLYHGVPEVAPNAPGHQLRAQYLADLATHSTWRSRLEAGSRRLRAMSLSVLGGRSAEDAYPGPSSADQIPRCSASPSPGAESRRRGTAACPLA